MSDNGPGVIYAAINLITGKIYIGQTVRKFNIRISRHFSDSKFYDSKFPRALKKYSKNDWEWKILYNNAPREYLSAMERWVVANYDTYNCGYNSTIGGETSYGEFNSFYGKRHSDETKKHWSNIRSGIKVPRDLVEKRVKSLSRCWVVFQNGGGIVMVKNMSEYCRANNLDSGLMGKVASGERNHHKGNKCVKLNKNQYLW